MPLGTLSGVHAGAPVRATGMPLQVPVGDALLGRVLDGLGRPVDGGPPLGSRRLARSTWPARRRTRCAAPAVDQPLTFGVRALDTLVPCGKGQRLGIFAGSGVGKSSLLSHDHPRHRRRRPRHRPDRRAWPRGARVPRGRPRRPRAWRAPSSSSPPPTSRRWCGCRPPSWPPGSPSAFRDQGRDVLLLMDSPHPHRHGPARGRPVGRRAAGHPRLPAERLRDDAAAAGAGRHRRDRRRSPASTPCWSRATTTTSRSPTPPARSSTGTSC